MLTSNRPTIQHRNKQTECGSEGGCQVGHFGLGLDFGLRTSDFGFSLYLVRGLVWLGSHRTGFGLQTSDFGLFVFSKRLGLAGVTWGQVRTSDFGLRFLFVFSKRPGLAEVTSDWVRTSDFGLRVLFVFRTRPGLAAVTSDWVRTSDFGLRTFCI